MTGTVTTAADWRRERARKRTVRAALDLFNAALPGTFKGRAWAHGKITAAKAPGREARRLVEWFRRQDVTGSEPDADHIDHSDVQELRVKILRRDGVLDQPQAMALARLDKMIAGGSLDRATFNRLASIALAMPCAWPKPKRAETRLSGLSATTLPDPCRLLPEHKENCGFPDLTPQGSDPRIAA